ncbi:unnamed protein product [Prorocentrum cordatum]|uniref:Anoctamin transmembrane domain-containing protein n=1 Tax=Prorocentrum cordatum TaxID=2364126 RepID=A0ABN9Y5L0_9DINO|nr:unnamed protein product [Polarella glacialis]
MALPARWEMADAYQTHPGSAAGASVRSASALQVLALKFIREAGVVPSTELFGVEMNCMRQDCFLDIQGQLAVFVIFRLTVPSATGAPQVPQVMNLIEYFWPKLKRAVQACWCHGVTGEARSRHVPGRQDAEEGDSRWAIKLLPRRAGAAAALPYPEVSGGFQRSPWVVMATLLGTLLEIWIDRQKLLQDSQRPLPVKARANEPWTSAFEVFGFVAASTNVLLLIFEQYTNFTLTEKLTLFVYLEHLLFLAKVITKMLFPEVPRNVQLLQLKQDDDGTPMSGEHQGRAPPGRTSPHSAGTVRTTRWRCSSRTTSRRRTPSPRSRCATMGPPMTMYAGMLDAMSLSRDGRSRSRGDHSREAHSRPESQSQSRPEREQAQSRPSRPEASQDQEEQDTP